MPIDVYFPWDVCEGISARVLSPVEILKPEDLVPKSIMVMGRIEATTI